MFSWLLISAAVSVVAAAAPPPCCAYNGDGSATMQGNAVLDINNGVGAQIYGVTLSVNPHAPAVAVLVNSSNPETAVAGWIISGNATAQTLTLWYNNTASTTPVCGSASGVPGTFVPGFALCPGVAGSLFPNFASSYNFGNVAVNAYVQADSIASFVSSDNGCAMTSLLAHSPLNNEFFSVNPFAGVPESPPGYTAIPSFCVAAGAL